MSHLVAKLVEAQQHAMAIRPKAGGFPVLAEVLRRAGVLRNRWSLPSCQSVYLMKDGAVVQQGAPLLTGEEEVPKFDREALVQALRRDQSGAGTFPEFLRASWKAGVVAYDVNFEAREVTYHGVRGESYTERYPAVEVSSP